MIGALTGQKLAQDRAAGSAAAALIAAQRGAAIVRVHDVVPTRDALAVWQAVAAGEASPRKPAMRKSASWDED
jgi:dihydropteroate synthase